MSPDALVRALLEEYESQGPVVLGELSSTFGRAPLLGPGYTDAEMRLALRNQRRAVYAYSSTSS